MSTPTQADQLAGRYIYDSHGDAWNKLRFADPSKPSDPKPAETLYNFIDGDAEANNQTGTVRDDVYRGGFKDDTFMGRAGNDHMFGQADQDLLFGEDGADRGYGGTGNDGLTGGAGDDLLYGDAGIDLLTGNDGNDTLWGGDDSDAFDGGPDRDTLHGEAGGDTLLAGDGDDVLVGGDGPDGYTGGPGNDTLESGKDQDQDLFFFQPGDGHDRIRGFEPDIDILSVLGKTPDQLRYTGDGQGNTLVTWSDPNTDVLLLGIAPGDIT